jgi:hypothetical protein
MPGGEDTPHIGMHFQLNTNIAGLQNMTFATNWQTKPLSPVSMH